jgi:outer membrane protein OmpA-like peptidoglycan-associated protein
MRTQATIIISAAFVLSVALAAGTASAQTGGSAAAPSESDISRSLAPKSRGLPQLGDLPPTPPSPSIHSTSTAPAPAHMPNPVKKTAHAVAPPPDAHPSATLRTIQFQFGSAELTPDSIETLKNLGNALNHELADQAHFVIEGHTDAYGEAGYNAELSKERAEAVKDYLIKQMGVTEDRLQAVGKGSAEPVTGASPYSALNRRVVVVNLEG